MQFEAILAELTDLLPSRIRRIVYNHGGEDFAIACRALEIEKLTFASLFIQVRKRCLKERSVSPGRLSKVMTLYDNVTPKAALQVVERWRASRDFPGIVEQIEIGDKEPDEAIILARASSH